MKTDIKQLREQAGYDLRGFAQAMGASVSTVTSWQSGRREMPVSQALRALDVLASRGVIATLDQLYCRS